MINAAAYTNVEAAEDDPDRAHLVNATAAGWLAAAARDEGLAFVHVSTDFVFDGDQVGRLRGERRTEPAERLRRLEVGGRAGGGGRLPTGPHHPHRLGVRPRRGQLPIEDPGGGAARG